MKTLLLERFLNVGNSVMVEFTAHTRENPRIKSDIRGWKDKSFVVLGKDRDGESARAVLHGEQCVVRLLHEGRICGFRTQVLDPSTSVDPVFRVRWPQEMEVLALRKHERFHVDLPCTVSAPDGAIIQGVMRDLSLRGCGIVLNADLAVNSEIRISFNLLGASDLRDIRATVRNVFVKNGAFHTGIQFVDPDDALQHDIQLFVATQVEGIRDAKAGPAA
jgi:c-di-GMP-binding flagellar brake protein YcgR